MVGEAQVLLADVTVHVAYICPVCPTHVTGAGTTSKMQFNVNVFLVKAFCVSTNACDVVLRGSINCTCTRVCNGTEENGRNLWNLLS